jgi:hypothetical protein
VGGFAAVVERALGVHEDAHVVVGVDTPPHAHSGGAVEAQVFQALHIASTRETASGWK